MTNAIDRIARQVAETADFTDTPNPRTGAYEPIIEDYDQLAGFIADGIRAYLAQDVSGPAEAATPQEGDTGKITILPVGGRPVTISLVYGAARSGEIEPCLTVDGVYILLDAWRQVDPSRRNFAWPTTDRDDDDCMIAFISETTGTLVMDVWPVVNDHDLFSLMILPDLLPGHYAFLGEEGS